MSSTDPTQAEHKANSDSKPIACGGAISLSSKTFCSLGPASLVTAAGPWLQPHSATIGKMSSAAQLDHFL